MTKFKFFTDVAYDTKSNHPLRYNFGFYVPILSPAPIYFYSSTLRLQTETILPSGQYKYYLNYHKYILYTYIINIIYTIFISYIVNSDVSKIKTVLKVCNIYESCSITEGPDISIRHPINLLDTDGT